MFSFGEIVIFFALALVVLGPKKLPGVAAQVGRWLGRARAMARQFREQLEHEVNAATDLDSRGPRRDPPPPPPPEYQTPPPPATADAEPTPEMLHASGDHRDLGGDHRDLGAAPAVEPIAFPGPGPYEAAPEPTAPAPAASPPAAAPEAPPHDHTAHPELEVYAPTAPPSRAPGAS